jgi:hypothetical protein
MPVLQFFGPSGWDSDNRAANSTRLLNCYLEPVQPGGRAGFSVKAALGMTAFSSVPGVFVRAMAEVNGILYVVCNSRLYSIDASGTVTDNGAVDDNINATVTGNFGKVAVTVDSRYFVLDGTIGEPTPGAFSAMGAAEYIGGYTVITEAGGRRFQWSALGDAETLPGLNFSSADGKDDLCVRPYEINGSLYIFKERSHEVWYLTGLAGASAFERQVGGVISVGLKGFGLICRIDLGAFMVGDDNRAYIVGQGLLPVSNPAVETAIKTLNPQFCFTYDDEGHTFCAITFRDGPARVYDVATREWHERSYGADFGPWQVTAAARVGALQCVARDGGDVLTLERSATDDGIPLPRRMVSRTLADDGQRFVVDELEIFPRQGFDAASIMLRMSRDNGMTWGSPKVRSFDVGQYGKRVIWRALGQFRQATAEITISDAKEITMNAEGRLALS